MKCQGLTVQTVEHIFITHLHGDHVRHQHARARACARVLISD
jgi:glyoxylase-like metal-dependent hydrolase (beta-lactamase superfamily II)